jgi:hypothetical protein
VRPGSPFKPDDLDELDARLLERAVAVVTMQSVADGQRWKHVIGMRHDVDNVIEPAVRFAAWEADRGYRSTYYILHTAPYWRNELLLRTSLEMVAELGHEIGIHNNAIAEALVCGRDPREILTEAIGRLRGFGFPISSTVAHGDSLCYGDDGKVRFVNDEMFAECARGTFGAADRMIGQLSLRPVPLSSFGLDFDANWIGRAAYLSDSGGRWSDPGFDQTAQAFPFDGGQLHMLIHPDWWGDAFVSEGIAA